MIITFDKAYVDYAQYEKFTHTGIFYVTRLKSNAKFILTVRYEVHPEEIVTIIEDADIEFEYTDKKGNKRIHKPRKGKQIRQENIDSKLYPLRFNGDRHLQTAENEKHFKERNMKSGSSHLGVKPFFLLLSY